MIELWYLRQFFVLQQHFVTIIIFIYAQMYCCAWTDFHYHILETFLKILVRWKLHSQNIGTGHDLVGGVVVRASLR